MSLAQDLAFEKISPPLNPFPGATINLVALPNPLNLQTVPTYGSYCKGVRHQMRCTAMMRWMPIYY